MDVGDDFDGGKGMIKCNDGVKKHEEGLGNVKDIFHGSSCSRLKVTDAVIPNVANCSSGQGWQV